MRRYEREGECLEKQVLRLRAAHVRRTSLRMTSLFDTGSDLFLQAGAQGQLDERALLHFVGLG